ncbi:unnamed protein product [Microthlaspi erraticum]|uniref:TF-B3 domain-containing protein n=1 Tax=Microthlaspi erraticum TaxID=1685480 RepID=A0A6D2J440_9BRAS|nr:unnamed protein product [Microthlaspi erraticum]
MDKEYSSDDCLPKFFKVYLPDDSGADLDIPISFNSCLPKPLPKNVIVRSIYGKVWKLKLSKCSGDIEKYAMVDGWKRIVKDEDLKGGEFLTFEFDGSRLFNFCVYGHTTCKRLASSVRSKPAEVESDGGEDEDEKSSVEIIAIDSDDDEDDDDYDDDGDEDDDEDSGDEEKCSEDVIVLSDDDDQDRSSEDIIVLNDDDEEDDDYADGDEEEEEEEDEDDYADGDQDDEAEIKEKVSKKSDGGDERQYLDNYMNPFFKVNLNRQRKIDLCMQAKVIRDYGLHFPEFINLIDPLEKTFGKLRRKVEGHTIKGFQSVIRRNKVKSTDKMICELKTEMNGLVREIKVHVISG